MNPERLMKVLLAPIISEKSTQIGEKHGQYIFRVLDDATKPEIKAAVELLFSKKDAKIEVIGVRVLNVRGKEKKVGKIQGRRRHWKKAYVSLKSGQDINYQAAE
ncbi:MAG: 50S ribosomal protein L23 [Burkholderiales bacterium]